MEFREKDHPVETPIWILFLLVMRFIRCSSFNNFCKKDADCENQCQQCDNGSCMPVEPCVSCTSMSCSGNGKCANPSGAIVCECNVGYRDERCDRRQDGFQDWDKDGECLPDCHTAALSCPENSRYFDTKGIARCECQKGYAGDQCTLCGGGYQDNDNDGSCLVNCSTAALDCGEGGRCEDNSGVARCACETGYAGPECQECAAGFEWDSVNQWCAVVGMKLTAGDYHTCLLKQTGIVVCWGAGLMARNKWMDFGQSNPPDGMDDFVDIAAGHLHTCGIRADTSVVCWGYYGLDSGNPDEDDLIPVYSPNTQGFVELSSAGDHTCGLKKDGSIECWDTAGNSLRAPSAPNKGFYEVTTGSTHTRGLQGDNTVECWGSDDVTRFQPTVSGAPYLQLSSGESHTCAIQETGEIICFSPHESMTEVPTSLEPFIQIDSVENHACALNQTGEILCWPSLEQPEENSGFIQVATGCLYACGLKRDGSVHCWGDDTYGQSAPSTAQRKYAKLASSAWTSCAVTQDGYVYCFGNTKIVAKTPVDNTNFSAVDVGPYFACGIRSPGYIVCWGDEDRLEFSFFNFNPGTHDNDFIRVAVGEYHACGLKTDGSVYCWGDSMGYVPADKNTDLDDLPKFRDISAGFNKSCGITRDGKAVCWTDASRFSSRFKESSDLFIGIEVEDMLGEAYGVTQIGEVVSDSPRASLPDDDDNTGFIQIDIGPLGDGGCGVKKDNTIECWGDYAEAVFKFEGSDYATVQVGFGFACALRSNGDISCLPQNGLRAADVL